jgi:hypothetical protein
MLLPCTEKAAKPAKKMVDQKKANKKKDGAKEKPRKQKTKVQAKKDPAAKKKVTEKKVDAKEAGEEKNEPAKKTAPSEKPKAPRRSRTSLLTSPRRRPPPTHTSNRPRHLLRTSPGPIRRKAETTSKPGEKDLASPRGTSQGIAACRRGIRQAFGRVVRHCRRGARAVWPEIQEPGRQGRPPSAPCCCAWRPKCAYALWANQVEESNNERIKSDWRIKVQPNYIIDAARRHRSILLTP